MPTVATFQGYPLFELEYRRSRGYTPGGARMVILAESFPAGFEFKVPRPGDLTNARERPEHVVGSTVPNLVTPIGPVPPARSLDYEGWLVMSETVGGQTWEHPPVRLFVVAVNTVRDSQGQVALVEITAYDVRYHWDRGWCRRHSYNRRRPDGTIALDSVKEDGTPLNRREIAQDVCSALFRAPRLARAPQDWEHDTTAVEFLPNSAPVVNLAQLVDASDLAEPCLLLDESVALYRHGEGMVGYAKSPGAPNSEPFPPELLLHKDGTGQGHLVELQYPEDYVIVAGGLKVVTVAIDDCVPVLDAYGLTIEINDENIRWITGGKFDTEWLRRFVLAPPELAGDPGLPEPIAAMFREQAYRLWQVRGVEREVVVTELDAPRPIDRTGEIDPDRLAEGDLTGRAAVNPLAGAGQRRFVRQPGPNAHLLPILPRAETQAGRRLPPLLETYTFAARHKALVGGGAAARQAEVIRRIAALRNEIVAASNAQGNANPFSGSIAKFGNVKDQEKLDLRQFVSEIDKYHLTEAGGSLDELAEFVGQARMVERIAEQAGGGYAQRYEALLRERFAAEDEAGGHATLLYDVAKRFLEMEKGARERRKSFRTSETVSEAFRRLGYTGALSSEIRALIREFRRRQEEERRTRQLGGGSEGADVPSMIVYVNVARTVDVGARVYSAERGIFESSGLAGHLVTPEIHDLSHPDAQLSVCPVRAVFGATLRPRLDVPYLTIPRPQTGSPDPRDDGRDCPGGDNVIPSALEDAECYYLAAFKRGPSGAAIPVRLADVPPGQALVVQRPDLVELVGLNGETNRGRLDLEAQRIAAELFRAKPLVRTSRTVVARPWPVQCDGVVETVEIRLRPNAAGFETVVITGTGTLDPVSTGTREDPARRGAAALRAQNEAARREGVRS